MFNTILNSISNMSSFNMILLIFFIIGVIEGLYIFFTKFEKEITIDEKYTYGGNGINQSISDKENNIYGKKFNVLFTLGKSRSFQQHGY